MVAGGFSFLGYGFGAEVGEDGGEGEVVGGGLALEGGEGAGGALFGFPFVALFPLLGEEFCEGFLVGAGGEFGAGSDWAEVGVVDDFVYGFGGFPGF